MKKQIVSKMKDSKNQTVSKMKKFKNSKKRYTCFCEETGAPASAPVGVSARRLRDEVVQLRSDQAQLRDSVDGQELSQPRQPQKMLGKYSK